MTEDPQPRELGPNSLLAQLMPLAIERFQVVKTNPDYRDAQGNPIPYYLDDACNHIVRFATNTLQIPVADLAKNLSQETSFSPEDVQADVLLDYDSWNDFYASLSSRILITEIKQRHSDIASEDNLRGEQESQ